MPVEDICVLATLAKLQVLDLSATQVGDISSLVELEDMQSLDLRCAGAEDLMPVEHLMDAGADVQLAVRVLEIFQQATVPQRLSCYSFLSSRLNSMISPASAVRRKT